MLVNKFNNIYSSLIKLQQVPQKNLNISEVWDYLNKNKRELVFMFEKDKEDNINTNKVFILSNALLFKYYELAKVKYFINVHIIAHYNDPVEYWDYKASDYISYKEDIHKIGSIGSKKVFYFTVPSNVVYMHTIEFKARIRGYITWVYEGRNYPQESRYLYDIDLI